MNHQLPIYRAITAVSTRTLAAARRGDWDEVVAEQDRCRELVDELRAIPPSALSEVERLEKFEILVRLVDEDAQIRDLVQPWMQKLERMLNTAGNERRLDASYGSGR